MKCHNKPLKLQPCSKARLFVGYNEGSKSVLYYNAETRKVLISQNFCFLHLTHDKTPSELQFSPTLLHEGELGDVGDTQKNQNDLMRMNNNNNKCLREQ